MCYRAWGEGNSEKQTEMRCYRCFWNPSYVWTINIVMSAKIIAIHFRTFKLLTTTYIFHRAVFNVNTLSTSGRVAGNAEPEPLSLVSIFSIFLLLPLSLLLFYTDFVCLPFCFSIRTMNVPVSTRKVTQRVVIEHNATVHVRTFITKLYKRFFFKLHTQVHKYQSEHTFSDWRPSCRIALSRAVYGGRIGKSVKKTTP